MADGAKIIDGKAIALECQERLRPAVAAFAARKGYPPGLGVILVGENPASAVYVKNKELACKKVGIASFHHALPATASSADVAALIRKLNEDRRVHGILLQLPLPAHIAEQEMLRSINPAKDADGFHPVSAGNLAVGAPTYVPCTPKGCMVLLRSTGSAIAGMRAVVVGRSNIVGKPVAQLLLAEHATVTICHSKTRDLAAEVRNADILIAAIGKPEMIAGAWIKPGAIVIDVGINRRADGTLCGDVAFADAKRNAGWITPVPGGVGPMTVAMLLENTVEGAQRYDE
ncbi:MAG: bifunctional methylenetetrahydrofolate dehydrogenase/methenyltetrahydrofolate cyclohydrolase FolD [Planctomycetes bacterium]|nr:bifunctional methylenetetrahydrofolate dehydrogenase/methenyltetrahydrofolate cyclohydrolase FolD [Planctomycetota bacterium]